MKQFHLSLGLLFVLATSFTACTSSQAKNGSAENVIAKTVDVTEWERLTKDQPGTVLDVRTQEEFDKGAVPNAVLIDWYSDTFNQEVGKLNKELPVYIYCHSGGRSKRAMNRMSGLGFTEIYNLKGGMMAWREAHK